MKLPHFINEPYPECLLRWALDIGWDAELPDISIEDLFKNLKKRDRDIVECYYKNRMTMKAIGNEYEITTERVRQILLLSMRKISHMAKNIKWELDRQEALLKTDFDPDDENFILLLDLPVRAFNCLARARLCSFNQIKNTIETGKIWKLRNLGTVTGNIIIDKFNETYQFIIGGGQLRKIEPIIDSKYEIAAKELGPLNLQTRTFNALVRADICTFDQLTNAFANGKLYEIKDFGKMSIEYIHKLLLEKYGMTISFERECEINDQN